MRILSKCITVIISLFISISILSGCSRVDMLNFITSRDKTDFHEMLDAVFAALDSGDNEGLKKLFANTVISENPDLENQIDELFQVYNGPMEIESINLSQLKDEIGMPNVDETWYCYYKLSDNRFIQCNYYGDTIEKFSVVDSEQRLYTLWEAKTFIE